MSNAEISKDMVNSVKHRSFSAKAHIDKQSLITRKFHRVDVSDVEGSLRGGGCVVLGRRRSWSLSRDESPGR